MAQFRATISGQRGGASRLGSKASGIEANVDGWDAGVRVIARHVDGKDVFDVFRTGGSNGATRTEFLASFVDGEPGVTIGKNESIA
jgi:hypothetical protein